MSNNSVKLFLGVMLFVLVGFQSKALAQDGKFRVPLNGGTLISGCGFNSTICYVKGKYHSGADYGSTGDNSVLASNAGKIVDFQYMNSNDHGMGTAVIIEHHAYDTAGQPVTLYTTYNHLAGLIPGIYRGQTVVKGQKIGTMGGSGYGNPSYWSKHLHFELKYSPVLSNSWGTGTYYGYMPGDAVNYGYIDTVWAVNSLPAVNANDYAYWEFSGDGNLEGWELWNWTAWSVNGGTLFIDPAANDPHIKSPELYVDASVLKHLKFSMASNAADGNGAVYFKTAAENSYNEDKKVSFPVTNNGLFKDYTIPLYSHPKWSGKITGVRIDPANFGNGTYADTIGWHWIRLSSTP